jgi:hypothetical protein
MTSTGGPLMVRELDERPGLTERDLLRPTWRIPACSGVHSFICRIRADGRESNFKWAIFCTSQCKALIINYMATA